VKPEALTALARRAFHDVNFFLRKKHNDQVAKIMSDPEASPNDKFVAARHADERHGVGARPAAFLPGHRHRDCRR